MPGAESRAEIGDVGLGSEALVDQFQQPDAPGIGVAMLFRLSKKQKVDLASTPTKTGSLAWKISSRRPIANAGEVVLLVDCPGRSNGAVHDVVHGPHREPVIEDVSKQFDHAADGTMADQHQGQDKLPQPSLGDRQVEEDLLGLGFRVRRLG